MKGQDFKKKIMQLAQSKHTYLLFLGFMLFIYCSILIFQIFRWLGFSYYLVFKDFYLNILLYSSLPIPKIQQVYYYYTSVHLTNPLVIIIFNFFYCQAVAFWVLSLKLLLLICYVLELYITAIDLLLDLTRFFIFYADTDVKEFVRKHPVFDARTEFFVDKRLLNLMSYLNETLPSYYTYIPRILIKKYDYICSVIWNYVKSNFPNIALVYTAFSFIYFIWVLSVYCIISTLDIVSENYFSILILFTGIMNDLLFWCYPWLYHYNFVDSFSISTYIDFLHSHKHPRGVNVLLLFMISNFLDKAFNTNIIPKTCTLVRFLFFKLKGIWVYLKCRKLLFFVVMVVFLALPKIS